MSDTCELCGAKKKRHRRADGKLDTAQCKSCGWQRRQAVKRGEPWYCVSKAAHNRLVDGKLKAISYTEDFNGRRICSLCREERGWNPELSRDRGISAAKEWLEYATPEERLVHSRWL